MSINYIIWQNSPNHPSQNKNLPTPTYLPLPEEENFINHPPEKLLAQPLKQSKILSKKWSKKWSKK